ncbi:unnamed protein product [Mycena citricolor]|uniref:RWD domain-containing protein n=1 Tax=Mycena citricolor TaxID=2018698 RepID=A0AAD2K3Y8_9AGAR|nr:unnamed protein product [Mycena citricolor]
MSSEALVEEFEVGFHPENERQITHLSQVLEAIYPSELQKISETCIQLEVEPEDYDEADGDERIKVTLEVQYPPQYPDILPELSIEPIDGESEISDSEILELLEDLRSVGEENLGIAMTFTLVSRLREQLSALVKKRYERRRREDMEKERLAIEAEEARTRGTPVTVESFRAWKVKFDREMVELQKLREEERLKGLSPKERDEYKRVGGRASGRQLFERNKNLEDDNLMEEGTVSVDVSQYDRSAAHHEEEDDEEDALAFSDSD